MNMAKRNQKLHNPNSPLLIGDVNGGDVVMEVNEPSYIDSQTRLFYSILPNYCAGFGKNSWAITHLVV